MTDTGQLLRDYAERGSEEAFRELVTRYIDLVYSVALRRLGGNTHLAEDIVQTVFTDLARKARSLRGEPMLGGWLHRHTCFVSSTFMRGERRRQERERQAIDMNMLLHSVDSPWDEIAPVLDEAVDELDEADRRAVLLRFFEQRDLRAVGAALGTNEDAAQKRVGRAVEKLRGLLAKRGVTLSVAALATILGSQAVLGAPAGLSAQVSNAALTSAAADVGFTALVLKLTTPAKVSIALSVVAVALLVRPWGMRQYLAKTRDATRPAPNGSSSTQGASAALPAGALNPAASKSTGAVVSPPSTDSAVLRLSIVAADSGQPVPNVPIDYGWAAERKLKANREGV